MEKIVHREKSRKSARSFLSREIRIDTRKKGTQTRESTEGSENGKSCNGTRLKKPDKKIGK